MAIVQISRITQRKGLIADLPQPLAGAEFGWAIDERRLFIGNGALIEGAPVVGNTEVLTEFSDILGFATSYTYQGEAGGYTVQTGPTIGTPVSQSIQARLDSYAVVTDFGAVGDGVTDDTAAINRALFQLYCRQENPQIRRSLFFPAGEYIVTDTIKVPPYAMLYGEGNNSSIINFQVLAHTTAIAYESGVLVSSAGVFYRSLAYVPIGISLSNPLYWNVETLPAYIMRTADSLQQTGVSIGTNGATPPRNIELSGMAFATNQINSGILIENAQECYFNGINITGPLTTVDIQSNLAVDDIAAVRWASTASLITSSVVWNNCNFSGFTYGTDTEEQVKGVTISNSSFTTLYKGIVLGGVSPENGGPTGFRIMHNKFDTIYVQGIEIVGVSLNASGYNIFYDVGNQFNGVAIPASSIIDIDADNNVSIGDMFQRSTAQSATYPRIELNNTVSIGVDSAAQTQLGTYTRVSGTVMTLPDNDTGTVTTVDTTNSKAFKFDYTIIRDTDYRTGTIMVASAGGATESYTDSYTENTSTGVTLTVSETAGIVSVEYATTSTGLDASISYSITHLA